jgi:hypothetical protein
MGALFMLFFMVFLQLIEEILDKEIIFASNNDFVVRLGFLPKDGKNGIGEECNQSSIKFRIGSF